MNIFRRSLFVFKEIQEDCGILYIQPATATEPWHESDLSLAHSTWKPCADPLTDEIKPKTESREPLTRPKLGAFVINVIGTHTLDTDGTRFGFLPHYLISGTS